MCIAKYFCLSTRHTACTSHAFHMQYTYDSITDVQELLIYGEENDVSTNGQFILYSRVHIATLVTSFQGFGVFKSSKSYNKQLLIPLADDRC